MAARRGGVTVPISTEFNNRGLEQANKQLSAFGKTVKKSFIGIGAGLGGAFALSALTDQFRQLVDAGSRLQESQSKVNVVFGQSADRIDQWSNTASTAMVMSKQAALEAAGTFGNLFQAFGVGQGKATEMSTTLVQLAADLASFNNTSTEDAITALRSGLSGETEPLKRYGVALNDARLKAEAMAQGIYDGKGMLDATQKSLAAYALILKDTKLAQGDVERTADNYANTMRSVSAAVENAQAIIGTELVKSITDVTTAVGGPQGMTQGIEGAAEAIANLIDISNDAIGPLATLSGSIDSVVPDWLGGFANMGWNRVLGPLGGLVDGLSASKDASALASRANEFLYQGYVRMANPISEVADEQARMTTGMEKQRTAADRLKMSLDALYGNNRSRAQLRLDLKRLRQEGPDKSGERTVIGPDGKPVTKRFTTKMDAQQFAIDYANTASQLAGTFKLPGRQAGVLTNAQSFLRGRVRGFGVGGGYVNGLIGAPDYLTNPRPWESMYDRKSDKGFGGTVIRIDKVVVNGETPAEVVQKVKQWTRLKAVGRGMGAVGVTN